MGRRPKPEGHAVGVYTRVPPDTLAALELHAERFRVPLTVVTLWAVLDRLDRGDLGDLSGDLYPAAFPRVAAHLRPHEMLALDVLRGRASRSAAFRAALLRAAGDLRWVPELVRGAVEG